MRKILITTLVLVGLVLSTHGCSAYRIDIRQGNTLEPEVVNSLRVGMSKQQVTFLLGTPLIRDPFHPNRWDYAYTFQPGGGEMTRQHLSLFFEGDELVKIDKSGFTATTETTTTP
jgi:outer membrane protein assembly factor BamE